MLFVLMYKREDIISYVKEFGPILPAKIAKNFNINLLFASAALSELVAHNEVKISYLKIGGSPLYYAPGQEELLSNFARNLNSKDKQTHDLLQQGKVLRESSLDPFTKVSLRNLRDFAKPLSVEFNNNEEIFWKWHLLSNDEASTMIKRLLEPELPKEIPKEISKEIQKEEMPVLSSKPLKRLSGFDTKEKQDMPLPPISQHKDNLPVVSAKTIQHQPVTVPAKMQNPSISVQKVPIERAAVVKKPLLVSASRSEMKGSKPAERSAQPIGSKQPNVSQPEPKSADESFSQKIFSESLKDFYTNLSKDDFLKQLNIYFEDNKIEILSFIQKKKNTDHEFVLMVPSAIGNIRYYCSAKNKKRINEGDLATAYVQGKVKNLPVFFLTTGSLIKKLEERLSMPNNEFKDIIVKNIS